MEGNTAHQQRSSFEPNQSRGARYILADTAAKPPPFNDQGATGSDDAQSSAPSEGPSRGSGTPGADHDATGNG